MSKMYGEKVHQAIQIIRIIIKNRNREEWKPTDQLTWTGCCCSIRHFWGCVENRFPARLLYLTSPACSSFSHWCRTCRLPDNVTLGTGQSEPEMVPPVLSGGHLLVIWGAHMTHVCSMLMDCEFRPMTRKETTAQAGHTIRLFNRHDHRWWD